MPTTPSFDEIVVVENVSIPAELYDYAESIAQELEDFTIEDVVSAVFAIAIEDHRHARENKDGE